MHDFIHECVGFMCRCGFLFVMEYNDFKKNQPVGVEISSKKEKEKREKKKKKRNIHCLLSLPTTCHHTIVSPFHLSTLKKPTSHYYSTLTNLHSKTTHADDCNH